MRKVCGLIVGLLALVGCDDENGNELQGTPIRAPNLDDPGAADTGPAGSTPMCTTQGRKYVGFGNADLVATRVDGLAGSDRARLKPFAALKSEYTRVTGSSPSSLDAWAPTFGIPEPRWYSEPISSALIVTTTYAVSF